MKKLLLCLLLTCLFILPGCGKDDEAETESVESPQEEAAPSGDGTAAEQQVFLPGDNLLVASAAGISGNFLSDFALTKGDKAVSKLVSSEWYGTYVENPDGGMSINAVCIKDVSTEEDDKGNRTYTFTLHDDLYFSDGSEITAKDYIFSLLLRARDDWSSAGSTQDMGEDLLGYYAYSSGTQDYFQGVRLIDQYTFALTVQKDTANDERAVCIYPAPSEAWAQGNAIENSDEGARIIEINFDKVMETVLRREIFAPMITAGPYIFLSFTDGMVTLEKNRFFKGDAAGGTPYYNNIVVREMSFHQGIDEIIAGTVDIAEGSAFAAAVEKLEVADTAFSSLAKPTALAVMLFHCDFGPASDENVRKAIACLIDTGEIVKTMTGGSASDIRGDYLPNDWVAQMKSGEIFKTLEKIGSKTANEYLDASGYTYESDGKTPYNPEKAKEGYLRHNAEGESLTIEFLGALDSELSVILQSQIEENAYLAGVEFKITQMEEEYLVQYMGLGGKLQEDRVYHCFEAQITPTVEKSSASITPYYIYDEKINEIISDLKEIPVTERAEYSEKWMEYQTQWNNLLPAIPLYPVQTLIAGNSRIDFIQGESAGSWVDLICSVTPAGD